jgi:hypothetical protein
MMENGPGVGTMRATCSPDAAKPRVPRRFGALAASGHQHHRDIEELLRIRRVRRSDHPVHDQDPSSSAVVFGPDSR